jgi:hypothetical protein
MYPASIALLIASRVATVNEVPKIDSKCGGERWGTDLVRCPELGRAFFAGPLATKTAAPRGKGVTRIGNHLLQ